MVSLGSGADMLIDWHKLRAKNILDWPRARRLMEARNLDGLVVFTPENYFYVAGAPSILLNVARMPGITSLIIRYEDALNPIIVCMDFEEPSLRQQTWIQDIRSYDTWVGLRTKDVFELTAEQLRQELEKPQLFERSLDVISATIQAAGLAHGRVGLELDWLPASFFVQLQSTLPQVQWVNATDLFYELRSVKSPEEIEIFRLMTEWTEKGLQAAIDATEAGCTERDLIAIYRGEIFKSEEFLPNEWSFFAAGPNGGRLGPSTDYRLRPGDPVKFDGGVNCGYHCYTTDMARVFFIGQPSSEARKLHQTLTDANRRAIAAMKPGVPIRDIFRIGLETVRSVYPWYTRGHLGHSISLGPFTTEPPLITPHEERLLEPGMIFAVEIPCYIRDWGGMNIEDLVLITEDGHEELTQITHDIIIR